MVIVAVICIIAIAFGSFRYVSKQEERFLDRLEQTPVEEFIFLTSEGDSLQIQPERTTIILFWATWAERSLGSLYDLYQWHDNYPQYDVIAAFVKDAPEFARAHDRDGQDRFRMLDGTTAYQDLRVPGVPTTLVLNARGEVSMTGVGAQNIPVWHELSTRKQLQSGSEH